jgi:hypothetical protein
MAPGHGNGATNLAIDGTEHGNDATNFAIDGTELGNDATDLGTDGTEHRIDPSGIRTFTWMSEIDTDHAPRAMPDTGNSSAADAPPTL